MQVHQDKLEFELGYQVSWKVLDSVCFGVPQSRKRVFIVGTKRSARFGVPTQDEKVSLDNFEPTFSILNDVLEKGKKTMNTDFTRKLLSHFTIEELYGKSIKDKRGGDNNIHSWDIGVKGECTKDQIILLNRLFKERRKKQWADEIGIDWMDGMPLTLNQIQSFYPPNNLFESIDVKAMLDDLVEKGYIKFEHPKKLISEATANGIITSRVYDGTNPKASIL